MYSVIEFPLNKKLEDTPLGQCRLVSVCGDSKGLVSAVGRASGNATEFYPHIPLPGQRRVRQLANKIMLLIQKLEDKKQY